MRLWRRRVLVQARSRCALPRSSLLLSSSRPLTLSCVTAFFNDALRHVSTPPPPVSSLYFVDDSALNVRGANALGWRHCVLFDEGGSEEDRLGSVEVVPAGEKDEGAVGDAEKPRVSVVHDLEGASSSFLLAPFRRSRTSRLLPLSNFH